jgi:uncharacterized iron-regulated membrane protein
MDVVAPVEMYDAMHRELLHAAGTAVDGLLVHVARPTDTGFEIIEIWESREPFDRYTAQLVAPVMARVLGEQPPPAMETEEFDVRGLVLPRGGIAK